MLETTPSERRLRVDARRVFEAALAAVEPARLVREALALGPSLLPPPGGRLLVIAVGKAAVPMATGAGAALEGEPFEGLLLTPRGVPGQAPGAFRMYQGGHPLPDEEGLAGARQVREWLQGTGPRDRILLLLSGGGSALLTLPHGGVSLDDLRGTTALLLRAGASIGELNAVRKHLEALKGGRFAALGQPAPVTAFVLSDVVGDPLDVIASGPVSGDPTTFADAIDVLEAKGVWSSVPEAVRRHLVLGREGDVEETPGPGDAKLEGVQVRVVGNAEMAARAAAAEALRLGYRSEVGPTWVTGEAREVGARLATLARELRAAGRLPACVVWAGETTVTVRGKGVGGRSQELALAAAMGLEGEKDVLVLAVGTDGVDGPTDAAGAFASGTTVSRARAQGIDPGRHLEGNDAHPFFEALGDLVRTGPTGTNVMDLMLVLAATSS